MDFEYRLLVFILYLSGLPIAFYLICFAHALWLDDVDAKNEGWLALMWPIVLLISFLGLCFSLCFNAACWLRDKARQRIARWKLVS